MRGLGQEDQPSFSWCSKCNIWDQLYYHLPGKFQPFWASLKIVLVSFAEFFFTLFKSLLLTFWRNLNTQNRSVLLISPISQAGSSSVKYSKTILRASLTTAIKWCLAVSFKKSDSNDSRTSRNKSLSSMPVPLRTARWAVGPCSISSGRLALRPEPEGRRPQYDGLELSLDSGGDRDSLRITVPWLHSVTVLAFAGFQQSYCELAVQASEPRRKDHVFTTWHWQAARASLSHFTAMTSQGSLSSCWFTCKSRTWRDDNQKFYL